MNPECKRCLKKGSGCWQHPDLKQEPKIATKNKKPDPWGKIPGKCNSRKLGGDGLCRQPAGWGTDHNGIGSCKRHGGAMQNHRKHAQKVIAAQAQVTYGLPREVDPHTALLEEVHRTAGAVAWLAQVIQSYEDPEALVHGKTIELRKGESWEKAPIRHAAPAVWLDMYSRERRHLTDVCKTAIACGLAERHVKLAEEQGQMLAQVIQDFARALAAEFGFDPEAEAVRKAARQSLTLVAGKVAA